jgi:hypothetical protein
MANWFVRSSATGTGAGTSWTNATTTIAAAITLSTAGDTFFVSDDHAETTASNLTLAFKGTFGAPDTVVCADHTITTPGSGDLKTTATVATTGNSFILISGSLYCYGITFNCGTGAGTASLALGNTNSRYQQYERCAFNQVQTGATFIDISASVFTKIEWINTTCSFGAVGQAINPRSGFFEWRSTASAITGATLPTVLFTGTALVGQGIRIEGVDLSALGSGKTLFNVAPYAIPAVIKDCKLGSAVSVTTGTPSVAGWDIDLIRCDSGNTNYRNERYNFAGTQTTETTIVRTGGATDGTTSFSHKVVTNTNAAKQQAFRMAPLIIWNDVVGSSKTVTVEAISSAVLNNDECWMEVEYLGDASSPAGSSTSTYKVNILATGAANTTSTSTWGGALSGKFKMAATITPQQRGPITVYVKVAKASATIYIDPLITLS